MIDIPVNAEVQCFDGHVGHSTYVIVNPINQHLTHLVVKDNRLPFKEHLVPVGLVEETAPDLIRLSCTRGELRKMEPFIQQEYIRVILPDFEKWKYSYVAWPYVVPANDYNFEPERYIPVERENIPLGEFAVRRGARVEATDGYIGRVVELMVNSKNMQVTHVVVQEKHPRSHRDVVIPVSQIDRVEKKSVHLILDKRGIDELPTIPVQRWSL